MAVGAFLEDVGRAVAQVRAEVAAGAYTRPLFSSTLSRF